MPKEIDLFEKQKSKHIKKQGGDTNLKKTALSFIKKSCQYQYSYNFTWLGRPIIQFPQDILALQEIIWAVKPDLIIETGIAHGGSLIFHASMLELLNKGEVVGIDIDIRKHNKKEIIKHPLAKRIRLLEGSSTDPLIIKQVKSIAKNHKKILVCLDSHHTHDHVLKELELYSPLVTKGSYCIVFDTIIEYLPNEFFSTREWGRGNNPSTAVKQFLRKSKNFLVDKMIENKLMITVAPGGYLKRIR